MKNLKTIFAIVIAAMTFGACSNDLESDYKRNAVRLRSEAEAINIAVSAHNTFFSNDSRGNSTITIAEGGVHVVKGRSSRGLSNDTLYYVVNFEDKEGFALVSALPYGEPLIGISERGYYDPEVRSDNENFNYFIENLSVAENIEIGPFRPPFTPSERHLIDSVNPKVQVIWGQSAPYGDHCFNYIAGCANTATAMVMSYFKQPTTMRITYDGPPRNYAYFDWEEMCKHAKIPSRSCGEENTDSIHTLLAQLCRQIGYDAGSIYHYDEDGNGYRTSTSITGMKYSLEKYGYSVGVSYYFEKNTCMESLRQNYLVVIFGQTEEGSGHAWIMDGFKHYGTGQYTLNGLEATETYFHYNWGWDGDSNGYFLSNVFDTGNAMTFDNPAWTLANYNFENNVGFYTVTY